ncbi:citrate synthase [Herbaspirillum sp. GW103]|jgi:citrate synthase|uniref:citrate synthase family protein n=1 Tax=unclassified Herbaspirillum TaxID=2624150 RepID=UPI00025E38C4|nr:MULTISPECIES: citrate synthase family protein [unclassified Herbaspirillum]EIJ47686.1 citrate synthase [Herbaspirillum sp. GW103]MCI1006696.1 helix-turn-helix domain-containing protein [Herbaspirillum sp. C7C8]
MSRYLTSAEAATLLGISRQTLYAYVSRGLLHAHPGGQARDSRYLATDVERLAANRSRGRKPREVARATLDWGLPVLESALTLIEDGRLYYRGVDAAQLSATATVEEVAALLWDCNVEDAFDGTLPTVCARLATVQADWARGRAEQTLLPLFALACGEDIGAQWHLPRPRQLASCGLLVRRLAACLLGTAPATGPLHLQCASAWGLDEAAAQLVRRALVLCADHELNASGFTARCVASTGASLQAAIIGGLAALSGPLHGGTTARVEALLDALDNQADPVAAVQERLARGEELPGFGHHLYPQGDVRASALLAPLLSSHPRWQAVIEAVRTLTGHPPSVDFALVALRRHLQLPPGSAFGLFALGRSLGWIAHALEQGRSGGLIRPRAAYTGVRPG